VAKREMGERAPRRKLVESLQIGDFLIRRMETGQLYVENRDGEGMVTDDAKLAAALRDFWQKEF